MSYTEQDTEQARRAERAVSTPVMRLSTMADGSDTRRNNMVALALIGLGALMLGSRLLPGAGEFTGGLVLLTISSGFLFFAFWRHIYGLLIPGSILAGLSLGVPFASLTDGVSVLWGLALGFLAIYLAGRLLFKQRSPWPIIPSAILFIVGMIVAVANLPAIFGGTFVWLPLLLIGAGLYLGWGRRAQP